MKPIQNRIIRQIFSDSHFGHMLIGSNGTIAAVSDNLQRLTKVEHDICGKKLDAVFMPIAKYNHDCLDQAFFTKHPTCPANLYITRTQEKKTENPASVLSRGIFYISYGNPVTIQKTPYLLLTLVPHGITLESPVVQWLIGLFRQAKQPIVVLNDQLKIYSYNAQFLSLLNLFDDSKVMGAPIIDFLDEGCRNPNPFISDFAGVPSTSPRTSKRWKDIVSIVPENSTKGSRFLVKNPGIRINRSGPSLLLRSTRLRSPHQPYCVISKAINFPNQDLSIEINGSVEKGSDITLALGRPFFGTERRHFDHGYHVDCSFDETVRSHFYRNSSPMVRAETDGVNESSFLLAIRRIGPVFSVTINGKEGIRYVDPNPVFGFLASHLYMYVWKGSIRIKTLTIKGRPSAYDFEKESKRQRFVSFSTVPGKLFQFVLDPICCINEPGYALSFSPVPVLPFKDVQNTLVRSMEEVRDYIQQNYFRKINFKSLAEKCGISYVHFINKFREYFGKTPKAYQIEGRLAESRSLLKAGRFKIREIAEMVGIEDEVNFHHLFRKHFGTSPALWAKKERDHKTQV